MTTRNLSRAVALTLVLFGLSCAGWAWLRPQRGAAPALPALQGAAALEHLRQTGQYASLEAAMTAARYGAQAMTTTQGEAAGSRFVMNNSAQRLRAEFAPTGVDLAPATTGGWRLGWHLRSAGYGEAQNGLSPGTFTARDNRIEYERPLTTESAIRHPPSTSGTSTRPPGWSRASRWPHRRQ